MYNQPQTPSLYVGDLAEDVTEQTLHEKFTNIGNVASIRVCRDHTTRQSLGYAYVNFHNAVDADRAIQTLNFSDINGKQCRIMWSQRDPTLRKSGLGNIFIKNIDPTIDNKRLMDLFSVFGNILSCKVSTDFEGKSKGYGYVHYDSTEAAKKAIEKYDKSYMSNLQMSVTLFQRREDREKQLEWTNVFIKNIPKDWDEDRIKNLFSKFGKTTSTKISRDLEPNAQGEFPHRGFGFVDFESHESAKNAVDHFTNQPFTTAPGVVLYVDKFKSKLQRQRDNVAARRFEHMQRNSGVSLYVKNLEDSINEEIMNDLFSKYGNVLSTRVMRDGNGYSRGFGFVSFSNVEEARNALSELNNCIILGKPIKVYLALSRDQRRAQNQANPQLFPRPGIPYPPSMYGVPMYMQHNQVGSGPRSYPLMSMSRPSQQRPGIPIRGYPIPSYTMNHFNPSSQSYPTNQYPQQQQQQMQRKPRLTGKVVTNQRNQRPNVGLNDNVPQQNLIHPNEPLTSQLLASMDETQRKTLIGERLYPRIIELCPNYAPKITGMLLEMDNTELLHLLETQSSLNLKVQEAIHVLENYSQTHQ